MPFRDADRRVTGKDALRRAGDARRFKPAYERRPPACRAGNLIDDGQLRYSYDAWNRLVKVTRKTDTDIVIQTAEYDDLGRRVSKVVTKSDDLDGIFVYY
ncbi:MAG: hypothetical protein FLDDKLPJ_03779 [Phycisphaerae bacterium]|nr:hypothetical protein [Phycisphaerae bacterium]